jgi:cytochrome-b5 reductase
VSIPQIDIGQWLTVGLQSSGALSSQNINGVYIPSALIIVGVAIVKREWLPYALVVVSLLGGYKVFNNRTRNFSG